MQKFRHREGTLLLGRLVSVQSPHETVLRNMKTAKMLVKQRSEQPMSNFHVLAIILWHKELWYYRNACQDHAMGLAYRNCMICLKVMGTFRTLQVRGT